MIIYHIDCVNVPKPKLLIRLRNRRGLFGPFLKSLESATGEQTSGTPDTLIMALFSLHRNSGKTEITSQRHAYPAQRFYSTRPVS
jgi:hypothetical protein